MTNNVTVVNRTVVVNQKNVTDVAMVAPVRVANAAKGSIANATIIAREGDHLIGTIE